jgi:hypothetical protein
MLSEDISYTYIYVAQYKVDLKTTYTELKL